MLTLLNVLTVEPANQSSLVELLRTNTDTVVATLDGWLSTKLIASTDGKRVIIYSEWRDAEAVEAMRQHPSMRAYFPRITALATFDSIPGEVVHSRLRG
jgi:quinol monooxygenase YgiN